jgi:prepilin-type N-terminal cleavage/methylation domain-containing protein
MERQKMKKKGFTLVELLVVIAIIAMLLAILMPALSKVRQLAQRIMCSTNLSGIGKAMLTYSTDDKYESFPISGSSGSYWDRGSGTKAGVCTWDWRDPKAFPETTSGDKTATVSSCLYLLIKYADVSSNQFICPGSDMKKFELKNYDMGTTTLANNTSTDVWDFGKKTTPGGENPKTLGSRGKGHQSYSYEMPFIFKAVQDNGSVKASASASCHPVTATANPSKAVLADRNPYWQFPSDSRSLAILYVWDSSNNKIVPSSTTKGNSTYHQQDGQNVLYVDQHAKFEKSANCGIESDNIYTVWNCGAGQGPATPGVIGSGEDIYRQCGAGAQTSTTTPVPNLEPADNQCWPVSGDDNYLVSDLDSDV